MWQVKRSQEMRGGGRIPTDIVINFMKSSGGKEEASHLRKLDTSNEVPEKNYVQEKSFPRWKPITRGEFQRRKASFETWGDKLKEVEGGKRSDSFRRKFRSLENLSGDECRAKELEMSLKLKEIHELVRKIKNLAKMEEKREKETGKAFPERGVEEGEGSRCSGARGRWAFESRCNLNRKLVPIQFSTSFVTELGSEGKSFSEKILFKSVFVPSGNKRKGKVFRSTLEVLRQPETETNVGNTFVFL